MRFAFGLGIGLVVGIVLTYLVTGPIDWPGVRESAGERAAETGQRARDITVTASVRAALALQKDFGLLGGIQVETEDGVVTLRGTVATPEQHRLAELITRGVDGVEEVVNELDVRDDDAPVSHAPAISSGLATLTLIALLPPAFAGPAPTQPAADRPPAQRAALPLTAPAAAPAVQEIRLDAPAERRWLVRMQFSELPAVHGTWRRRPRPVRLWATAEGAEYLLDLDRFVLLLDAHQGLLFQLPADALGDAEAELQVLLPYPVPVVDELQEEAAGPVQIRDPELGIQEILLPFEDERLQALTSTRDGPAYMPNVERQEYRRVVRISIDAGRGRIEVYLPELPG